MIKAKCRQCGKILSASFCKLCRKCNDKSKLGKPKNTKLSKILTKKVLTSLYITKGLNCDQIGKIFNCSYGTILWNLRKHKLPVRTHADWLTGREFSEETKKTLSLKSSNFYKDKENHPFYNKKRPNHSKLMRGENNPMWNGGLSYEKYGATWTKELREAIRVRDGKKCILCNIKETTSRKLDIHHIDYNKKNNSELNLISLCAACHTKTNTNRDSWKKKLEELNANRLR